MTTHIRLLCGTALALLLLTCTVAAWANPQSPTTTADTAGACARVTGPAHGYCTDSPAEPAAVTAPATAQVAGPALASVVPGPLGGRGGLLLFSTAAIAGAVGLILTAERRAR
ncbi:hypothetical protein ACFV9E_11905 [Streptomyces sp. NPDC059835]|uniref:hypothetical protein n=1 Tax=Streptomyces sp. NPDC059835 TaxID=3346967 RepID=UPI00365D14E1